MSETGKAVFLSYASQDAEAARKICDALRSGGVEVWFDADGGLEHGDEWDAKIRKQIKECVLFIPVISANTQARHEGYFRIEWDLAAERARGIASGVPFILPVVIDDTREPDALVPDRFRMVQWTKLPSGVVTPDVKARYLKLWSHRTGVLKHEAGVAPASSRPSDDAGRMPALPEAGRRTALITTLIALIGIGAGWWLLGGRDKSAASSPPPAPVAVVAPAKSALAAAPLSEARQLAKKAQALFEDPNITRDDMLLAEDYLKQAVKADPADGEIWAISSELNSLFFRGGLDRAPERLEQARIQAERALKLAPRSTEAKFALASYLRGLDGPSLAEAEKILRELTVETPDDARVWISLGKVVWGAVGFKPNLARADDALTIFARAATIPAARAEALGQSGWLKFNLNRYTEAESDFDEALQIEPRATIPCALKGLIATVRGDLSAAHAAYDRMTDELRRSEGWVAAVADLWLRERHADKALEVLAGVTRDYLAGPSFTGTTDGLRGYAYLMDGKTAAARSAWRVALKVVEQRLTENPRERFLLLERANLLALLDEREAAATALRLFEEVYPASASTVGLYRFQSIPVHVLLETPDLVVDLILERCAGVPTGGMRTDYRLERLQENPRYKELLSHEKVGAPPAAPVPNAKADPKSAPADKSVAVLAFANLSDDKENEYFSDGISEELLNVLGRVAGLRVAAPMSAFSFKGKNVSAQEIGQKLNVAYLVNGSVRRAGAEVRVVARLSRADTDEQIWTDKFTGEAKNVFALQDEIAGKIAAALSLKLGAAVRVAKPIDPEAYRLYLEGRHFWSLRSFGGFDRAEAALKQAVALEPESALMRAGLAELYATRGWYRAQNALDPGDSYALASAEAERAAALDPENAQAIVAHATIAIAQRHYPEAARLLRQALTLAPSDATALDRLGDLMVRTGRLDAAVENYQRGMQLDPLSVYLVRDVVRELTYARRFQDVIETVDRFEAAAPRDWRTIAWRSQALVHFGKADQAAIELKAILPSITPDEFSSSGASIAELVFSLRLAKCEPESEALAKQLLDRHRPGTYLHAMVLAARGRMDEALPLLVAFPTGTEDRLYWSAVFDPVREDPRFLRKIEEFGVAAEYKVARETHTRMLKEQEAKK